MSELQDLVKQLHEQRQIAALFLQNEKKLLAQLKKVATFQEYEKAKKHRLLESKEVRACEDELRQALIDDHLIDGDNRHPAVHSVTRKAVYSYEASDATKWAIENGLFQYLAIDTAKFDAYLAHLVEIGEPLPIGAWSGETVSVSLKSDLSDILGGDA